MASERKKIAKRIKKLLKGFKKSDDRRAIKKAIADAQHYTARLNATNEKLAASQDRTTKLTIRSATLQTKALEANLRAVELVNAVGGRDNQLLAELLGVKVVPVQDNTEAASESGEGDSAVAEALGGKGSPEKVEPPKTVEPKTEAPKAPKAADKPPAPTAKGEKHQRPS